MIGAGRGVGTTHFALMASNYFVNGLGYKTAVVECNGHGDFVKLYDETKNMDGDMRCFSYKGIDCCICPTTDELGQLYMKKYNVVICDMNYEAKDNIAEFLRCDVRIVVGSTSVYKLGRLIRAVEGFEGADFMVAVFMSDKKQLRKLTKNYNIKAVDIPVEINPMKMTSETLEWFAYYLGIT